MAQPLPSKRTPLEASASVPAWAFLLAPALTFLFYLPSLSNGFVNFDDTEYILNNTPIRFWSFPSLDWMATTVYAGYWMPLTWLSYSLDWKMGSGSPFPFHMTSLLLHCANVGLVFAVAKRILSFARPGTNPVLASLLTALVFGLHPLHVESVAWASERKDVLCAFFFLWGLKSYLDYTRGPVRSWKGLLPCLGLFGLALMSKPMAVTLPVVLLLLDAWPLGRLFPWTRKVLLEKVPFLLLSGLASWGILYAQGQVGALMSLEKFPFLFRLANACHSIAFYLMKMVFPSDLAALYPLGRTDQPFTLENLAGSGLVTGITTLCLWQWRRRPFLAVTWGFFLVTLLPVLGFFQVGSQAAADRYTYLPSLGLILLLGAAGSRLLKHDLRKALPPVLVISGILGSLTLLQATTWKDSLTLWQNAVRKHPGVSSVAYANLGDAYREAGLLPDALKAFDQAIQANPQDAMAHSGRAIVLFIMNRWQEAEVDWRTAIALEPRYLTAHQNFWIGLQRMGKFEESLSEAKRVAGLAPGSAMSWDLVAISSAQMNLFQEAMEASGHSLAMEPENPEWRRHRAVIQERMLNPKQSLEDFQKKLEGR